MTHFEFFLYLALGAGFVVAGGTLGLAFMQSLDELLDLAMRKARYAYRRYQFRHY